LECTYKLFILGRFAGDPESVLAAIYWLALVGIKLRLKLGVCIRNAGFELSIAPFTYADGRESSFYDSTFSRLHEYILVHQAGRV
jgi:hypothetical protein